MKPVSPTAWKAFSLVVLVLAAAWVFASAGQPSGASLAAPRQGFLAPDFSLQTLDGETVRLSELRGRPVLVNFWATWCPPCRAEMPAIQEIYTEKQTDGFVVLAVASLRQDSQPAIADYIASGGYTFAVLLDPDDAVFSAYRARSLPTSFFISPDGIIQEVVVGGPMAPALLRTRVESLFTQEGD